MAATFSVVGLLGSPLLAQADGYEYPIVVERTSPVLEEELQLGEGADVADTVSVAPAAVDADVVDESVATAVTPSADATAVANASARQEEPLLTGGMASAGFADTGRALSLYASEKVFRAEYEQDSELFDLEDARISAGFLFTELRDTIISGTYLMDTFPGLIPQVDFKVGTRLYLALLGIENRDVVGAGLGLQAKYSLPLDAFPLSIGASFFYTPDILAFGQSDRIIDASVDAGLELRENLSAFVGLRFLEFDTRPGTRKVEDDVHFGITWQLGASDSSARRNSAPSFR